MMVTRVGEVGHIQIECPRRFRELTGGITFVPSPHIAHPHSSFGRHFPIGLSKKPNGSMTGAIGKQSPDKTFVLAGPSIKSVDSRDFIAVHLNPVGMMIEEQIDVFLGGNDTFFFCVFKLFISPRRLGRLIGKLLHDLADSRILASSNMAHRPNTNFTRTVATKHWSVLNQSDFAA